MLKTYCEREQAPLEVKSSSEPNEASVTPGALPSAEVAPPSVQLVAEEPSSAEVSDVGLFAALTKRAVEL